MFRKQVNVGYNERLFSGGLRASLHYARFRWFQDRLKKLRFKCKSVLEIGCFDGKLIDFLPKTIDYLGYDANWEGGLNLAREKWKAYPQFSFQFARSADDIKLEDDRRFDIAVAMETLEHMPPEMVEGYLRKIAKHLDGYLFITVPNEIGPVFLFKWLFKKLFFRDAQPYTFIEFANEIIGRTQFVKRDEHKGFNYSQFIQEIEELFEIVEISGHPIGFMPPYLNVGVGIIATVRFSVSQ